MGEKYVEGPITFSKDLHIEGTDGYFIQILGAAGLQIGGKGEFLWISRSLAKKLGFIEEESGPVRGSVATHPHFDGNSIALVSKIKKK